MFSERSCASSRMITEYARSIGIALNLREQDAVGHELDRACRGPVSSLKRILQPTSRPHATLSSSATRCETLIAATRRGCVQPICPRTAGQRLQAHLRKLRRLPRARLARQDHHLMRAHGRDDLLAPRA